MKNPASRVWCLRVYRRNEGTYRTCGSSALPIATVPLPVAKGQGHPFLQLLELKEHPNDIKAEQTSDGTELGTRATSQRPQSFENKMCFGNVSGAQPPDERDFWDTMTRSCKSLQATSEGLNRSKHLLPTLRHTALVASAT